MHKAIARWYRQSGGYPLQQWLSLSLILLAFALRVHDLGYRSLWFDEAMEYWVAAVPFSALLQSVRTALQDPPFYSLVLHFWIRGGHSEFWLRFPSLVASLAGLLGVMALGRMLGGHKVSLVAGTLVAVSSPDIRFAQEAGQYAFMIAALSWNLVFLVRFLRDHRWRWGVLWILTGLVAVYTYYGAALTLVATTFVAGIYRGWGVRRPTLFRRILVLGGIQGLLTTPLLLAWLPHQVQRGPTAGALQGLTNLRSLEFGPFIARTLDLLVYHVVGYFPPSQWPWPAIPEWVVGLPMVALCLAGPMERKSRLFFAWLITGLGLTYLVSLVGAYPYVGRYSLILAPVLWVLVASGVVKLGGLWRPAAGFLWGTLILVSLSFPVESQEDLRSVVRFWMTHRHAHEVTYVYYGAVPGFRYQLNLLEPSEGITPLWYRQCWQGVALPECAEGNVIYGRGVRRLDPSGKRAAVVEAVGDPEHLWLIFSHTHPGEDAVIVHALLDEYHLADSYDAENARAVLLTRR